MLVVDDIRKRLGGKRVVDDVSLRCAAGEAVVIMGPNGAGKSTLLKVIAGVLEPDRGGVSIDGASIVGQRVAARRLIGYVPEAADPPPHLRVAELVALTGALKGGVALADDVADRLGVADIADKQIGALSLGERRRACLAAALVGRPKLLVLDEPTNGLDARRLEGLIEILREQMNAGCAIVVATHERQLAERLGGAVFRMNAGRSSNADQD